MDVQRQEDVLDCNSGGIVSIDLLMEAAAERAIDIGEYGHRVLRLRRSENDALVRAQILERCHARLRAGCFGDVALAVNVDGAAIEDEAAVLADVDELAADDRLVETGDHGFLDDVDLDLGSQLAHGRLHGFLGCRGRRE